MNVYDFDDTIYHGNSSVDFFRYCMKVQPRLRKKAPKIVFFSMLWVLRLYKLERLSMRITKYLARIEDIDQVIELFWDSHQDKVAQWYLDQQQQDDVVISASPYFLLRPICDRIGITNLIASNVDRYTGKYADRHCYGKQKVVQFRNMFGDAQIDNFYSDSRSDAPLAKLAKNSYIVTSNFTLKPW